jgi:hypothetical protein
MELIRQIEELAAEAWPAAVVEPLDGWRLRFTWSVTRRANSVWPNEADGRLSLTEKLDAVEAFYARRDCRARYQICPAAQPVVLDHTLAERGYTLAAPTCVQVATAETVLARAYSDAGHTVVVGGALTDEWFEAYCAAEGASAPGALHRRGILERIASPTGYALLEIDGRPAALGMGVAAWDWIGVFSMATHADFRRRGAATAVLHRLAAWGRQHGAKRLRERKGRRLDSGGAHRMCV